MIVIAAKVSVRKILACVLAAGTVLTGAAVLLPADAQPAAAASENMRLDVKLRTNEQRVALLRDCGWVVIEEPRGEREVQIPEEFDEVYESYNQIQLAQGLDGARLEAAEAVEREDMAQDGDEVLLDHAARGEPLGEAGE